MGKIKDWEIETDYNYEIPPTPVVSGAHVDINFDDFPLDELEHVWDAQERFIEKMVISRSFIVYQNLKADAVQIH